MRRTRWLAGLMLLVACSGDVGAGTPTGPSPDFTFSIAPGTLTIVIGESGDYELTLTRSGGFTGAVTVTVANLPPGATATPLTIETGQTAGSVTITAGASTAPGVWTLTVRGSASVVGQRAKDATLVTRIVT